MLGNVSCSRSVLQNRARPLMAAAARQGNKKGLHEHTYLATMHKRNLCMERCEGICEFVNESLMLSSFRNTCGRQWGSIHRSRYESHDGEMPEHVKLMVDCCQGVLRALPPPPPPAHQIAATYMATVISSGSDCCAPGISDPTTNPIHDSCIIQWTGSREDDGYQMVCPPQSTTLTAQRLGQTDSSCQIGS